MADTEKHKLEDSTTIRKRRTPVIYWASVVIFGLIIITFVLGPLFQMVSGPQGAIKFGAYEGKNISFEQNNPDNYMYRYLSSANTPQTDNPIAYRMAWKNAYDYAKTKIYLDKESEKSGLSISQDRVDHLIAQAYTKDGAFDYEAYQALSQSEKQSLSEQAREQIEGSLISRAMNMRVLSDNSWKYIAASYPTKHSFEYVILPRGEMPRERVEAYMAASPIEFASGDISLVRIDKPYAEAQDTYDKIIAQGIDSLPLIDTAEAKDALSVRRSWVGAKSYVLKQLIKDKDALYSFLASAKGTQSPLFEGVAEDTSYILRIDSPFLAINLDEEGALRRISAEIAKQSPEFAEKHLKDQADKIIALVNDGFSMEDARGELPLYKASGIQPVVGRDQFDSMRGSDGQYALAYIGQDTDKLAQLFDLKKDEVTTIVTPLGFIVSKATEIKDTADEAEQSFEIRGMPWPKYRYMQTLESIANQSFADSINHAKGFKDNFDKTFNSLLKKN